MLAFSDLLTIFAANDALAKAIGHAPLSVECCAIAIFIVVVISVFLNRGKPPKKINSN
jgi:hypothetical protein